MPTLLQLVHGYPPEQLAGTEVYTQQVTRALRSRGWKVHVVAAHRSAGHRHGEVLRQTLPGGGQLARVVNNLPWRPLSRAEHAPLIEAPVQQLLDELTPDLVHVQHLLFLSAHLRMPAPSLGTLHDAWAWCARGGTLLREGSAPCEGPSPERCLPCYGDWSRGAAMEHGLARLAGKLSPALPAAQLHRAWRKLPGRVRGALRSGPGVRDDAQGFQARQASVAAAFSSLDQLVAPSRWLAGQAAAQGLGSVQHLPHGVHPGLPRGRDARSGPLVFLGSMTPHKGAHLVVEAWEQAGRPGALRLVGPAVDPNYASALPQELLDGPVPRAEVPRLLSGARALVMGSVWPENSPLVVLEARAAGCPVVVPEIGGLPELVRHGVDGLLYPPGDVQALGRALQELDRHPWDAVRPPPSFDEHCDNLQALYLKLIG